MYDDINTSREAIELIIGKLFCEERCKVIRGCGCMDEAITLRALLDERDRLRDALAAIICNETEFANSTVKRITRIARAALGENHE